MRYVSILVFDHGHWPAACRSMLLVFRETVLVEKIIAAGLYEEDYLLALFQHVFAEHRESFSKGTVLDVGANVGNHTVFFSRYFKRVIAFEPNPAAVKILEANLLLNAVTNVSVFPLGLAEQKANLRFYENSKGNFGASGFDASVVRSSHAIERTLCVDTGDRILYEMGLNEPIVFIKLDVEGYEIKALRGLRETLMRHRPVVLFEALKASGDDGSKAVIQYLRGIGYEHFYSLEPKVLASVRIKPRALRRIISGIHGLFANRAYYLSKLNEPEDRYYPMIIASTNLL